MYVLTQKALDVLKKDKKIRKKVALTMGIGENAILMSMRNTKGRSIANNYDGFNMLIDETGMITKDLREEDCGE